MQHWYGGRGDPSFSNDFHRMEIFLAKSLYFHQDCNFVAIWSNIWDYLYKQCLTFGHDVKNCLTSRTSISMLLKNCKTIFCLLQTKMFDGECFVMWPWKFRCLTNNVWPFGQGLMQPMIKHCLSNIWNQHIKQCLTVGPHQNHCLTSKYNKNVLRNVSGKIRKFFVRHKEKKCLMSNALQPGQRWNILPYKQISNVWQTMFDRVARAWEIKIEG